MASNKRTKTLPSMTFVKRTKALTACSLFLAALTSPYAALANGGERFQAFQQFQQNNPDLAGRELKMRFHDEWKSVRNGNDGIPGAIHNNAEIQNLISPASTGLNAGADNVANKLSKLEAKAARQALRLEHQGLGNIDNVRTIQSVGSRVVGANNLSIDLGSAVENITLGSNLFKDAGSVTITVGSEAKTLSAGSKVTAAEYVAAKQVLIAGGQKVTIDASRTATGGSVDLSALTADNKSMRIDDLKITEGVTAYGDFGKGGDIRITGDLVNNGGIVAYSSQKNVDVANVRADNIVNNAGANISSGLNAELGGVVDNVSLGLYANNNLANYGNISSAGDLTLSAGNNLSNTGTVVAQNSVNLQAPNITNAGSIASVASNINLDSSISSTLNVNNAGGTLTALDGAINIRNSQFSDAFDTEVIGGDLISKEVNLNSGKGTADINVSVLTGTVNSTGTAAHVQAQTDTLIIGKQCLTGDPTYYNTGNIEITGDIVVGEKLAIIAGGNITATNQVSSIVARDNDGQGYDINIVAGANISINAENSHVEILASDYAGGNIDFSSASTTFVIDASSSKSNASGGNISLFAFGTESAGGEILLPSSSEIRTGGMGTGATGNIFIVAPKTISVGEIAASGARGDCYIDVLANGVTTSNGQSVIFDTYGNIISSNFLTGSYADLTGTLQVGDITSTSDIYLSAGGTATLGNVTSTGGEIWIDSKSTLSALNVDAFGDLGVKARDSMIVNNLVSRAGYMDVSSYGEGRIEAGDISAFDDVFIRNSKNFESGDITSRNAGIWVRGDLVRANDFHAFGSVSVYGATSLGNVVADIGFIEIEGYRDYLHVLSATAKSRISIRCDEGDLEIGNIFSSADYIGISGRSNINVSGNIFAQKQISISSLVDGADIVVSGSMRSSNDYVSIFSEGSISVADVRAFTRITLSTAERLGEGSLVGDNLVADTGGVSLISRGQVTVNAIHASLDVTVGSYYNPSPENVSVGVVNSTNGKISLQSRGQITTGNVTARGDILIRNMIENLEPNSRISTGNVSSTLFTVGIISSGDISVQDVSGSSIGINSASGDVSAGVLTADKISLVSSSGNLVATVNSREVSSLVAFSGADITNAFAGVAKFGTISMGDNSHLTITSSAATGVLQIDANLTIIGDAGKITYLSKGGVVINAGQFANQIKVSTEDGFESVTLNAGLVTIGLNNSVEYQSGFNIFASDIERINTDNLTLTSFTGSIGTDSSYVKTSADQVKINAFQNVYLETAKLGSSEVRGFLSVVNNTQGGDISLTGNIQAGQLDVRTRTEGNIFANGTITSDSISISSAQNLTISGDLKGTVSPVLNLQADQNISQIGGTLTAERVNLNAGNAISQLKNIVSNTLSITQGQKLESSIFNGSSVTAAILNLRSTNSSIGSNTNDRFILGNQFAYVSAVSDANSVILQSNRTSGLQTLGLGFAGGDFDYLGASSTTLSENIATANGNINIAIAANRLTLSSDTILQANGASPGKGNISFQVTDISKNAKKTSVITFEPGAELHTDALAGSGNILISVGSVTAPVAGKAPKTNIAFSETGGGKIFWGKKASGFVGANTFTAKGANIILNNAIGSKAIVFNRTVVDADPPIFSNLGGGFDSVSNAETSLLGISETKSPAVLNTEIHSDVNAPSNGSFFANTNLLTNENDVANAVVEDDSFAVGRNFSNSVVDASICSDLGFVHYSEVNGQALQNVNLVKHSERVVFHQGNVLIVPQGDTVVETPQGNVNIAGKSVVLISVNDAGLAVFDFEDQHKGSVSVYANGHNVVLSPGRHVMITPHHTAEFAQINAIETIAHRNIAGAVRNEFKSHVSEFSIPTALDSVTSLRAMVQSNHPQAKKIAARLMKTTAVVMQLGGGQGEYQHYFKPRMTAMVK